MAQQVFDQYAPLAKVSANETIPVVAAIAQTRDGKDELLHGTVPFVPAGGLYVPVSAANRLPVEATLSGSVERVVLDVTDNMAGNPEGSSVRYAVGRNVRIRSNTSTGNGFLPIDCRGLVSLSMALVNPSSGNRRFFDHWGVIYYDSLGPFNVWGNARVAWESVNFGEVPPGSQLIVDLMPYVRRGYMSIGIWFHTYDPSDTPGEYTFHFRGVRSFLGVPDFDS